MSYFSSGKWDVGQVGHGISTALLERSKAVSLLQSLSFVSGSVEMLLCDVGLNHSTPYPVPFVVFHECGYHHMLFSFDLPVLTFDHFIG